MVGDDMNITYFDLHHSVDISSAITACIGYFDGLHLGHQKLIEHVKSIAKETRTIPSLITFEPDPWAVLHHMNEDTISHITPMKHRIEIGEQLGIEHWIILKFEDEMAKLSYEDFHEQVLSKLHLSTLVCGFDFHYASFGKGDVHTLRKQQAFFVDVVEEVSSKHQKISSTMIETFIKDGNMKDAMEYMGRPYEMRGCIQMGNRLGRKYGFPTANLKLDSMYVVPCKGVYIGSVKVKGSWKAAIINIGHNPTFNYQQQVSIEAHILQFHESIYGEHVAYRFFHYLRGEHKFADAQALVEQLNKDKAAANVFFEGRKGMFLCD